MALTSKQRQYYAGEINKILRGKDPSYMMSSADFDYLAKLMDQQIPLAVVLLGMHECNGEPRRVSLRYFKPAIEEHIRYWAKALPQ